MDPQTAELEARLQKFSLDEIDAKFTFTARLALENGWSLPFAKRVVAEYKRFLLLAVAAGHPVTPSDQVDQAWHLHLVYTRSYWHDLCANILGQPLHHGPTKGGSAEATRYHEQYQQTLTSYRRIFGTAPPGDIWPPASERFAPARHVRVDKRTAWVIPKPSALVPRRFGTSLVTASFIPLVVGVANPLNFNGQDFLLFYFMVTAMGIAGALVLRKVLRHQLTGPEPVITAPYETACLARGVPGVLQAALAKLIAEQQLVFIETPPKKWGPITLGSPKFKLHAPTLPVGLHPVETSILTLAYQDGGAEPQAILKVAKQEAEQVEQSLQSRELLETPETFRAARLSIILLLSSVWLLGFTKVIVGIWRDKPVGFLLLALLAMMFVIYLFSLRPLRTLAGDKLLSRIKHQNNFLKSLRPETAMNLVPLDLGLAVGLFGMSAGQHPEFGRLNQALQPVAASDGGTSGTSGCGGDGGGGGCGGGCGGCGGD